MLTAPGPNIDGAVATLVSGGGTSYVAGVTAANTVLSDAAAASTKTLVFLSDGADTSGGTLPAVPSGTTVRAFAIGSGSCTTGPIPMSAVAALGGPGSSCTQVTDLSVLDDVIGQQVGSTLSALSISVDGGAAVPIPPANIVPSLPQGGPASVTWTTSVTLASGNHNICVTATGSDVGGTGSASDCVTVQVATSTANCTATANCNLTSADGAKSTANLVVQGINDTVGIRPAATPPGGCAGVNCVTAYDVLFNTNVGAGTGVVGRDDGAERLDAVPEGRGLHRRREGDAQLHLELHHEERGAALQDHRPDAQGRHVLLREVHRGSERQVPVIGPVALSSAPDGIG